MSLSFALPLVVKPIAKRDVQLIVILQLPSIHGEATLHEQERADGSVDVRCEKFRALVPGQRGCEGLISAQRFEMKTISDTAGQGEGTIDTGAKGTGKARIMDVRAQPYLWDFREGDAIHLV